MKYCPTLIDCGTVICSCLLLLGIADLMMFRHVHSTHHTTAVQTNRERFPVRELHTVQSMEQVQEAFRRTEMPAQCWMIAAMADAWSSFMWPHTGLENCATGSGWAAV